MILSEDRQTHFAHLIVDGLWKDDLMDFDEDIEEQVMRTAKRAIAKFVQEFDEIDAKVRKSLQTLKRNVVEGSSEWDVLYIKYFEEELSRKGNA